MPFNYEQATNRLSDRHRHVIDDRIHFRVRKSFKEILGKVAEQYKLYPTSLLRIMIDECDMEKKLHELSKKPAKKRREFLERIFNDPDHDITFT